MSCACRACRACVVRACACSPTQGHCAMHTPQARARARVLSPPVLTNRPWFGVGRRKLRHRDVSGVLAGDDFVSHDQGDARESESENIERSWIELRSITAEFSFVSCRGSALRLLGYRGIATRGKGRLFCLGPCRHRWPLAPRHAHKAKQQSCAQDYGQVRSLLTHSRDGS